MDREKALEIVRRFSFDESCPRCGARMKVVTSRRAGGVRMRIRTCPMLACPEKYGTMEIPITETVRKALGAEADRVRHGRPERKTTHVESPSYGVRDVSDSKYNSELYGSKDDKREKTLARQRQWYYDHRDGGGV
jgi:hypothetical protein